MRTKRESSVAWRRDRCEPTLDLVACCHHEPLTRDQARHWTGRGSQPPIDLRAPCRKGVGECGRVAVDAAARRARFRQYEQARYVPDRPSAFVCDLRSQSDFPVQRGQQATDVGHDCLDLYDQQRPGGPVVRQDVDDSALAEHIERHLRRNLPAFVDESPQHGFDQACVSPITKSIDTLASAARRRCVQPRRRVSSRISLQNRTGSIGPSLARDDQPGLTPPSTPGLCRT